VPAHFQPTPILQIQCLSGRHSRLKHAGTGPVSTVIATGSVPAEANRHNGKLTFGRRLGSERAMSVRSSP
jgi:hypothetical protein